MATQKKITKAQLKKIHTLLSTKYPDMSTCSSYQPGSCGYYCNNRTNNVSELTFDEAKRFIENLEYWYYFKSVLNLIDLHVMSVDEFVKQYGSSEKDICEQSTKELKEIVKNYEIATLNPAKVHTPAIATQKSIEVLTSWLEEWVRREEYENAQTCKNMIDEVKTNHSLAYSILNQYGNEKVIAR